MITRIAIASLLLVAAHSAPVAAPRSSTAVARVVPNDNRVAAGTRHGDTLVLRLVARPGEWHPDGEAAPGAVVPALAVEGGTPSIPGPFVRIPTGTVAAVRVRNALADTLRLYGLHDRPLAGTPDTTPLVLAPGVARAVRFRLDAPGTYLYWGTTTRRAITFRTGEDAQLSGAIVVDPAGAPPSRDRVLVLGAWSDTVHRAGTRRQRVLGVVNGRSWPHTERLAYTVGDTVRWRVLNASADLHPMHLHGFYFRVTSRGDGVRDTIYAPRDGAPAGDLAVTESMTSAQTMTLTWVPERPGNWLFHCHIPEHFAPRGPLGTRPDSGDATPDHARGGMNGLVVGVTVRQRPGEVAEARTETGAASRPAEVRERRLRLLVRENVGSTGATPYFGYAIQAAGNAEPPPDTGLVGAPTLDLVRGEPVRITVVNRLPEPTAVHWHGIELESYYDGVPGFSGLGRRITPLIAPGDSFEVRFTPPRAGTFIYHTHADELRQQTAGLAGALVVREPGTVRDPATDIPIVLLGPTDFALNRRVVLLNGHTAPPPLTMTVGTTYRLRLIQMNVPRAGMTVDLRRGDALARWRPAAKDGAELPRSAREPQPARVFLGVGETADFEVTPDAPGDLRLEVRFGIPRGASSAAALSLGTVVLAGTWPIRIEAPRNRGSTPRDLVALPSRPPDRRATYGPDSSQYGELRMPTGPGPHPVAVLVHGGCFKAAYATLRDLSAMSDDLRAAGIATWNVEYRRLGQPGGGWPETYLDVGRALDHLRVLAHEHPLDLARVVVVGHSAGGHLAMWAASRAQLPAGSALHLSDPLPVRGVVDLAGPVDMRENIAGYEAACGDAVVTSLFGGAPGAVPERYAHGSASTRLPLGVPQVLVWGEHEEYIPRPLAEAHVEAARRAGDRARLVVVPGVNHFDLASPRSATWPHVLAAIRALLDGRLPADDEGGAPPRAVTPSTALVNGRWFDGTAFRPHTVYSVDGRFTSVRPARVDTTIDLTGSWIVPPFGEAHNHNVDGAVEARSRQALARYLADGVFYVKIQGNFPVGEEMRRRLPMNRPDGPDVVLAQAFLTASGGHPIQLHETVLLPGGYYPGFTWERLRDSLYVTIDSAADLESKWPHVRALRPDFIKAVLWGSGEFARRRDDQAFVGRRGLDPQLLPALVERAHRDGLRVSVHVNDAADFYHAVAAGVDEIVHGGSPSFFNTIEDRTADPRWMRDPAGMTRLLVEALRASDSIKPSYVPLSPEDVRLAAQRGIAVVTAITVLTRAPEDARAALRPAVAANLRLLREGGVTLVVGSDNPTDTSVLEVEQLAKLGVFDNRELLRMWSEVTPRAIFPGRRIGSLADGYEASFLALDGDPLTDWSNVRRIRLRFKQGVLLDG